MIEPISEAAKTFGIFSSLERAMEGTSFFLLLVIILAADCALLQVYGVGLFQVAGMSELLKPQLAVDTLVLFAFFSGFMSFAMPIVAVVAYDLVIYTIYGLWLRLRYKIYPIDFFITRPEPGYVHLSDLKKKAFSTMESFYLSTYKEAVRENK
jgi:hypothetical protein